MLTLKQETKQKEVMTTAHTDFSKALNAYAFFKVNNRETGKDLVQDTFIKTWSYIVKGGKIDAMKSFLYHILNNLIIDEYRKRKFASSSLDALLDAGFDPGVDNSDSMINMIDGKSAIFLIKKLPEIYQGVMTMRYIENLSLTEISVITGQSSNTVAVKANRGLGKLRILYNNRIKI